MKYWQKIKFGGLLKPADVQLLTHTHTCLATSVQSRLVCQIKIHHFLGQKQIFQIQLPPIFHAIWYKPISALKSYRYTGNWKLIKKSSLFQLGNEFEKLTSGRQKLIHLVKFSIVDHFTAATKIPSTCSTISKNACQHHRELLVQILLKNGQLQLIFYTEFLYAYIYTNIRPASTKTIHMYMNNIFHSGNFLKSPSVQFSICFNCQKLTT